MVLERWFCCSTVATTGFPLLHCALRSLHPRRLLKKKLQWQRVPMVKEIFNSTVGETQSWLEGHCRARTTYVLVGLLIRPRDNQRRRPLKTDSRATISYPPRHAAFCHFRPRWCGVISLGCANKHWPHAKAAVYRPYIRYTFLHPTCLSTLLRTSSYGLV